LTEQVRRAVLLLLLSQTAHADHIAPEADFRQFKDWAWFALGAASGFVAHELGHLFTDFILGKSVDFVPVKLGPFPFFAIQPCCNLTPQEQYVVASAGFMVQYVNSELILWVSPRIRSQRHAYLKGVLALDIGLSIGYAVSAFLPQGIAPQQSDTATMARGLGIPQWQVGLMVLAPAIVDTYRYLVPDSKWAPWVGVQSKLLVFGASFAF
jgi:hypothetical protein